MHWESGFERVYWMAIASRIHVCSHVIQSCHSLCCSLSHTDIFAFLLMTTTPPSTAPSTAHTATYDPPPSTLQHTHTHTHAVLPNHAWR